MILKDARSPGGRDEGPQRARVSYSRRGSLPANSLAHSIGPVAPIRSGVRGLGYKLGPAGPGWRAEHRASWLTRLEAA
jgi:hypothetical protein